MDIFWFVSVVRRELLFVIGLIEVTQIEAYSKCLYGF